MNKAWICTPLLVALSACQPLADSVGVSVDPDAIRPASSRLSSVLTAAAELGQLRGELLAECMLGEGFPQPAEALAMRRSVPERYRTAALTLLPIDFGPSTDVEARIYGFGGSTFPIDAGGDGVVVSRDDKFDREADLCQARIERRLPSLSPLQTQAAALSNKVRAAFVERAYPRLVPALLDRLECVRRKGYPKLAPARALHNEDMRAIVEMAGVTPGTPAPAAEPPGRSDVPIGEVRVFPPASTRTYTTSPGELKLSETYVSCAKATNFFDKVQAASDDARSEVEVLHAREGSELADELEALADTIVRTQEPETERQS